ncbi:hypothetical protein U14_01022 [Candidatus Moduliflexus flocculans]|uniref:Uncharacterized protein n=1 Tax=Candidatus Moduliflexus flocculans TaxID=1499966 RepID=A0A0S6VX47_9BACT|nr:hypothetical protein U14_01022 [Candidatus Moduliflexus flocculans]
MSSGSLFRAYQPGASVARSVRRCVTALLFFAFHPYWGHQFKMFHIGYIIFDSIVARYPSFA